MPGSPDPRRDGVPPGATGIAAMLVAICLMFGPLALTARSQGPLDVEPEELKPGLTADYRPLVAGGRALHRVDPKPAFTLGRSSPHPRIPPGPFEVVWAGVLQVQDPGPIAFSAFVGGEVDVEVDGVTVLDGRGRSETSRLGPTEPLTRAPGHYRLTIRYRSLADVPARLQIWWEGPTFAREPLPAWRLSHLRRTVTPELAREQLAGRGRDAVGRLGCARCHARRVPRRERPAAGAVAGRRGTPPRTGPGCCAGWPTRRRCGPGPACRRCSRPDRPGSWSAGSSPTSWAGRATAARTTRPPATTGRGGSRSSALGCAACHFVPDHGPRRPGGPGPRRLRRASATGWRPDDLAAFLGNPHGRYPDGRMPRLPVAPDAARDIAAYLLLWSKPSPSPPAAEAADGRGDPRRRPPAGRPRTQAGGRRDRAAAREAAAPHATPGSGRRRPRDVPIKADERRGCLAGQGDGCRDSRSTPRPARRSTAYLAVAVERGPPVALRRAAAPARAGRLRPLPPARQRPAAAHRGDRQHARRRLPPDDPRIQRTPRLTNPHQKFTRGYLADAVREGVSGLRSPRYTYRMPAFGTEAEALVQALAEADGELPAEADPPPRPAADPTLGTLRRPAAGRVPGLRLRLLPRLERPAARRSPTPAPSART